VIADFGSEVKIPPFQRMRNENDVKLETVSIAEPLQNRQHAQNP